MVVGLYIDGSCGYVSFLVFIQFHEAFRILLSPLTRVILHQGHQTLSTLSYSP